MSAASSLASSPPRTLRFSVIASRPLVLALLITAIVTLLRARGSVDSDVAWQLWIAGRIHHGANLYTDIIETNPPLWFWMALPLDRVAALLHARIEAVVVVAMGGCVALSLAAASTLIGHIDQFRQRLLLGYAALVLAAMPWMHVGQREQIVLIGALPYAAMIAHRRQNKEVAPALAAAIGLAAALGFALKHYFLIVPAVLELWLFAERARQWRAARPEIFAVLLVGGIYAAAIACIEPDFLSRIVPLVRLAYGAFGAPSIRYLFGPFALVGLIVFAVAALYVMRLPRGRAPFAEALFAAACAFAIVYFVQFKGWPYHAIPLIGCSSLALAAVAAELEVPPASLRIFAPALLLLPLALSAEEELHPALPGRDLLAAIAGLGPGESVGFLTTETAIPWSVTLQGHYRYASRYNGFWMMRAIIRNEASSHPDPAISALGREIISETVADFSCIPPQRIIVTRPRPGEDTFDILPFFLRDPHFAALLSHYRVRSRSSLETYDLVTPFRPSSEGCRQGV